MIAVTGITGHVGRITGAILLKQQQAVRAVVRNAAKGSEWAHLGADVKIADLADEEALTLAFKDAESVFIMTPPALELEEPLAAHLKMLDAIVAALRKSSAKKVVYLSSIGGHLPTGTGAIRKLYDMEQALSQLDIPTVGIRAGWFMENFNGSVQGAVTSGTLLSFLNPTNLRVPMVAVADIGKLAAELLLADWQGHRIIELEGPQAYSADDVAATIGNIADHEVKAVALERQDYEKTYASFGFTENASKLMAEMNDGFNSEWIIFEKNNTEHRRGNTTLEEMLKTEMNR